MEERNWPHGLSVKVRIGSRLEWLEAYQPAFPGQPSGADVDQQKARYAPGKFFYTWGAW